jgi:hypothetical protein
LEIRSIMPSSAALPTTERFVLQERAGVGGMGTVYRAIVLDDVTRGLLDVRFHLGRTASGAHTLLGEGLTLDASRPLLGKPTPCVGREAELGMLELVLAGCIEDATPRAVLVTASPGTGKSRLRHEFLRRVAGRGDAVQIAPTDTARLHSIWRRSVSPTPSCSPSILSRAARRRVRSPTTRRPRSSPTRPTT